MSKNGKCSRKACKTIVFYRQICKFVTFPVEWILVHFVRQIEAMVEKWLNRLVSGKISQCYIYIKKKQLCFLWKARTFSDCVLNRKLKPSYRQQGLEKAKSLILTAVITMIKGIRKRRRKRMVTFVPAYIAEHKSLTNCEHYKSHWMKQGSKLKQKSKSLFGDSQRKYRRQDKKYSCHVVQ